MHERPEGRTRLLPPPTDCVCGRLFEITQGISVCTSPVPKWIHISNSSSIRSANRLQMRENCSANQRPGNDGNLAGRDQKLISPRGYYNEFIHKFWYRFPERFVRKCAEPQCVTDGQARSYVTPFVGAKYAEVIPEMGIECQSRVII